jgi:hypothetical protein
VADCVNVRVELRLASSSALDRKVAERQLSTVPTLFATVKRNLVFNDRSRCQPAICTLKQSLTAVLEQSASMVEQANPGPTPEPKSLPRLTEVGHNITTSNNRSCLTTTSSRPFITVQTVPRPPVMSFAILKTPLSATVLICQLTLQIAPRSLHCGPPSEPIVCPFEKMLTIPSRSRNTHLLPEPF